MSSWIFTGQTYFKKQHKTIVDDFLFKLEENGLSDKEMYNFMNCEPINYSKEFEETIDLICTESPTKIYATGFYFLNKPREPKNLIKIIIDGFFSQNETTS